MRLITRNDASLAVGLIAGTVVTFQRPLHRVWETAGAIQDRYNVDLLPALTIFVGVLLLHEARKRQFVKAESRAAAAEAVHARTRSAELERLMTFSQALACAALDAATLEHAVWRYLPAFTGDREFWVLARRSDRWEMVLPAQTQAGVRSQSMEELEGMADRTLTPEILGEARHEGHREGSVLCFPMVAGESVGVLGIHDGATMPGDQRKALGVATGLIAIALRNMQLFLATREHSLRDSLTNCFNRGHGLETLERELQRTRRSRQPLSILLFDIDYFKTINDELGHQRGDDLLRAVGAQLTRVLRRTDVKCRYGGDEFLIILPDTPLLGAQQAADSVRRMMAPLAMVGGGRTITVTTSIGVATAGPEELGVNSLIARADEGLYLAKRGGRDRCHTADTAATSIGSESQTISPPKAGVQER